jgi:sulfide:quinone oxidoreductase
MADHRVLIAGAGVGGLEAALALRAHAGDRFRIDLVAPERCFTYRPLSVGEPFGRGATVQAELRDIAAERGFGLVRDAVSRLDAAAREVRTQGGLTLGYDALILSLGARPGTAVPGAITFRGPRDVPRLQAALEEVAKRDRPAITFVAGGSATWTLPLYELALLTEAWARESGLEAEIRIVTAERAPLAAFGPESSERVATLLRSRGIRVRTDTFAGHVEDGRLWIPIEGSIPADLAVALPYLKGPQIAGLPGDELDFVAVDEHCRVSGVQDVYAIGDMTRHPVKQGGLAAQMADVAAAAIAEAAGLPVVAEPFQPVLRALLFTGEQPLYLTGPSTGAAGRPAGEDGMLAPWWPAHKIVGAHLAPYLATHANLLTPALAER